MALTVEPLVALTVGNTPEWLYYEESNSTWEEMLGQGTYNNLKNDFGDGWTAWGLANGVCPGQEFLVEFRPPTWHRSGWEYEEWDVEYHWDVMMTTPRSAKQSARAWDLWKKACVKNRQSHRQWMARKQETVSR